MFRSPPDVNSCKTMIFSCFYPFGKAGRFQIPCCQGIAVKYYGVTLGALALKPSRFCNAGVTSDPRRQGNSPLILSRQLRTRPTIPGSRIVSPARSYQGVEPVQSIRLVRWWPLHFNLTVSWFPDKSIQYRYFKRFN